jgi:hypothetical protein
MSAFREFMLKEYPYYENAGRKNVEMWQQVWDAAIKHAEALKPSHNTGSTKLVALADRAILQLETMSLHQALDTITELRNQLRAGA